MNSFYRWVRLKILKLLRLRDGAEPIAKGIGVGVAIDFIPTFGFGPALAYLGAMLIRGNGVAAVFTSLAFQWATVAFFAANLIVGNLLLGRPLVKVHIPEESFFSWQNIKYYGDAFLLGTTINAILSGFICYYVSAYLIRLYRAKKLERKAKKEAANVKPEPNRLP